MSHVEAFPVVVAERGTAKLTNGKVSVTAPSCSTASIIIVTSNATAAEKANGIISAVEPEAGKFKVENSTGAGTQNVSWAILA